MTNSSCFLYVFNVHKFLFFVLIVLIQQIIHKYKKIIFRIHLKSIKPSNIILYDNTAYSKAKDLCLYEYYLT